MAIRLVQVTVQYEDDGIAIPVTLTEAVAWAWLTILGNLIENGPYNRVRLTIADVPTEGA
jgi:hypothetical protein